MKKKSNVDILMIMFGFTFFSGSMLIGQKLSSGVQFLDFLVCILIGGAILGIFGFISIIYAFNRQPIDIINAFGSGDRISIIVGLEMVIGSYISGAITTLNFSKYGKNPKLIAIICFCAFLLLYLVRQVIY